MRLGQELGTERLGVSLWELPAGQCAYPLHFHLADEEVLLVLEGTPDLRDATGTRTLATGELVAFRTGEGGAHQLVNRTETTVRFLAVSTAGTPDIVFYPEHGKVFAGERVQRDDGVVLFFRESDAGGYWDGVPEDPV